MSTMSAIATPNVGGPAPQGGAENVIAALAQRCADREDELRLALQQKAALEADTQQWKAKAEAYDSLLPGYMAQEEQLRSASRTNEQIDKKIEELEGLTRELRNENAQQKVQLSEKDERIAQLVNAEVELQSNRAAFSQLIDKSKENNKKTEALEKELSSYRELMQKSKSLANEQIKVLLENETKIDGLESKNSELEKVIESLEEQSKKDAQDREFKDHLINSQRQELGERDSLIETFETKFDAKNVDVPQVVARAEEGERLWAKAEEREKRYEAKEAMLQVFRDENTSLVEEKKRLEDEVNELESCVERKYYCLATNV